MKIEARSISLRDREIMIDRTCYRCGAEYEWGVHVAFFGRRAGFTDAEIRDLTDPDVNRTSFSPRDRVLLKLADELHDTSAVSDSLFAELARKWTPEQIVELVALAGYYHAVSYFVNAFRLPLEPMAARFPARPLRETRPTRSSV